MLPKPIRWLVLLLPLAGPAQAELPVEIDLRGRCDSADDTCPVPVAIMLRTNLSDEAFRTWHCEWDFGDDDPVSGGSAEWAQSMHPSGSLLALKNRAIGPIAGHVYEGFGSSPYTVTVTCDDGHDVGRDQVQVYTDDPDQVWGAGSTFCVSPAGQFADCPFSEAEGATHLTTDDFDAVVNLHAAAGVRILLHRGESFVQDERASLRELGGPSLLGAYGSGAAPIIAFPTQEEGNGRAALQLDGTTDWRIADLDYDGVGTGNRHFFCSTSACSTGGASELNRYILALRLDVLSPGAYAYDARRPGTPEIDADVDFFIVEGAVEGDGSLSNTNAIFGAHNGGGILGLDMNADTVHNVRIMCQLNSLYQHNDWGGSVTEGDDMRACSFEEGFTASGRTLISDSTFRNGLNIKGNESTPTEGMITSPGLFERNHLPGKTLALKFRHGWTVRNNLASRTGNPCYEVSRGQSNGGDFRDLLFYNNTCYREELGFGGGIHWAAEVSCADSSCECRDNLLYAVDSTDEACKDKTVAGVPITVAGNRNPATSPFAIDPPSERDHFALSASGRADAADRATMLEGLQTDVTGACRPFRTGAADLGAFEADAPEGPCLSVIQQSQDRDQQRCIDAHLKNVARLAKRRGKSAGTCLVNAAKGKLEALGAPPQPQTAQACLENDPRAKVGKAEEKAARDDAKRCQAEPSQLPAFAYTGSDEAVAATRRQTSGLVADLFGPDLDAALAPSTDKRSAPCQRTAQKEAQRLFDALWKSAIKATKNALKWNPELDTPREFELALLAALQVDPKLPKARFRLEDRLERTCSEALYLEDLFPGECPETDPDDLAICLIERTRCRFCETLNESTASRIDCDIFDDAAANGSCGG